MRKHTKRTRAPANRGAPLVLAAALLPALLAAVAADAELSTEAVRALEAELAASRDFDAGTLASLNESDREKVREGEVLAVLRDIPGSPVKVGRGIGVMPLPTEVIWQVLSDYEHYKAFMPFTKESTVDASRSGGDVVYFSSTLDIPFVSERYYTLKMTSEENVGGRSGTFFISWSLDPEKRSNLYLNSGSWKLVPYGPKGTETLACYTVITDPGGSIPNFIKNKSTKVGIPSVFEAIAKRAQEGLAAGTYQLPAPEGTVVAELKKRVEASAGLDASALDRLSADDRRDLEAGEPVVSMRDVEGTWVKMVRAVALFDAPSSRLWEVLTDYAAYEDFIPYVAESRVDAGRSRGNVTYLTERLHFVIFPLIKDRYFTVKISQQWTLGGEPGVGFIQWGLDPTRESNVTRNRGSWKVLPYRADRSRTLVFYTILADPGGLSPWFLKNLSARRAVRDVLEAIGERCASRDAGL